MEQRRYPVDVISVCSASGEIRPLRLRLEDEQRQLLRIDIEEIHSTRDIPYVGVEARVFLCSATVHQKKWVFELKYSIRKHSWCMERRIQ